MRFEHPHLLWLLLPALPALAGFFWWAWRTKRRLIARFVQSRLLANLTVGVSARRQKMRLVLLLISVGLLIVVLARPQWGFTWEEAKQRGLDIIVAIDTSRSMLAGDVNPNRLARAKLAALDLKRLARTDRVGLVAFAGTAFLQCPLSFDEEAFRQSLNALDVNIIPQGGSALAEAIQTAQAAFKEKNDNYKVLVLFTDGEDHDGQAVETARSAARDGMRIFTVGVGTANGELLRITDGKNRTDFIRDSQGNVVKSRLNEPLLRDLARAAGGVYMLLSGANSIELLYERQLGPLPKTELSSRRFKRFHERYQWLLGLTVVLLLLEMFLPERKRVQRSEPVLTAANLPMRKAAAVLVLSMCAVIAGASSSNAKRLYERGQYKEAQREYERLLEKEGALKEMHNAAIKIAQGKGEEIQAEISRRAEKGEFGDHRLHFNAGTAAYQDGDFDTAAVRFLFAATAPDLALQERAFYNLGNTLYRRGEQTDEANGKMESWEEAVKGFEAALALDPQDADAKFNLDLVKKKLEELKKQQQQQKQDSKDNQKDDSKQDQQKSDQKNEQKPPSDQEQKQQPSEQEQKQEQQKQEEQKPQPQNQDQKKEDQGQQAQPKDSGDKPEEQGAAANKARSVQMTPQEAQRLLDTLKSEEKAMIFTPRIKTNRTDRVFKDW